MPSQSNPLWPSASDLGDQRVAIQIGAGLAAALSAFFFLVMLVRGGTGVAADVSDTRLLAVSAVLAACAYGIARRSRLAAGALVLLCGAGMVGAPGMPRWVAILSVLFAVAALRATVLMRANTSLERTREG